MRNVKHAPLTIEAFDPFPRNRLLWSGEAPLCDAGREGAAYSRVWSGVCCPHCLGNPTFQRGFKARDHAVAALKRTSLGNPTPGGRDFLAHIPAMKLYVISPGVPPEAITEALLEPILDLALLPARYYVYPSDGWARVHLEAWGSWIEGGGDAYYEALGSLALPYDVFRYGEELSHRVEVAKIIKWDVETGRRSSGWRYSLEEGD